MEATQLFLKINKSGFNKEWNKKISCLIKGLTNIDDIQVIEENESIDAQINICYNIQKVPINKILELLAKTGSAIIEINMHSPIDISSVSEPYGAIAIGPAFSNGELRKVKGVSGIGVSSRRIIKVTLDPTFDNKQAAIDEILNSISSIRA